MRLWRRRPTPLQRLAQDLVPVAFRRYLDFGMDRAFRWGERDESGFDPLAWLLDDRPRLRMGPGFYLFVTSEAVPPSQ